MKRQNIAYHRVKGHALLRPNLSYLEAFGVKSQHLIRCDRRPFFVAYKENEDEGKYPEKDFQEYKY